ncbi:TPA: ankyrin repeat domain-containing protein [Campylobacter jejuni]|nr:ankyrin repeat domain-containing protein [Campylobacter jejuni]
MKTLEDIKAMSYQEKDELEDLVLEIIDNNDLVKLKDILKDYPVKISCYELNIKDEDGDFPLFDPFNLIIRAAHACEDNNDFSILDYLFDEYGLSLKDPKYNFVLIDMKHIKEANDKYILMEEVEDDPCIYQNALIYDYILNADNPNSQIIKYLVNRGAKFEVHDEGAYGWTPMHFWARRNNYQLLELAIKGGANVDMQTLLDPKSEYNETLLFEAVSEPETYRVTQLLIELGANVNFITPTSPLDNAKGSRNKKLLKDAGAMTSAQLDKKYNIYWDSEECKKDESYMEKYCKLLNDAIKKAKESE